MSSKEDYRMGEEKVSHSEEEYQELKRQLEDILKRYNELETILHSKSRKNMSEFFEINQQSIGEDSSPLMHAEKAFHNPNVDNLTALLQEVRKMARPRTVVVRFRDMGYWTNVVKSEIKTVGSALKALILGSGKKRRLDILKSLTGVILPGRMTLVIGPPGCGKSTFLKALSGRLHDSKAFVDGCITYNRDEANNQKNFLISKVVDYIEQDDIHAPTLTVFETLEFAWRCVSGGHHSYGLAKDEQAAVKLNELDEGLWRVNQLIAILGLKTCKDTIVGDNMIRGVSGGQKKRVTAGEFMVTNTSVRCFDSISNGLDSATTFDILRVIKLVCSTYNTVAIAALLQPSPEVLELFDDIILMSSGQIIYHGPREQIQEHFASLGYICPIHVDLADFLVQLPTPDGLTYKTTNMTSENYIPHNTNALVTAFKKTDIFNKMLIDLDNTTAVDDPSGWLPTDSKPYAGTHWYYIILLLRKQVVRMMRNTSLIRGRVSQTLIVATLIASLFTNLEITDFRSMLGFIFFCMLFLALANFSLMPDIVLEKAVFTKHADAMFYPTISFVISQSLVIYPLVIFEAVVFSSITYWSVGLSADGNGGRFITFILIVLLLSLNISQFFCAIASIAPSIEVAQPIGGLVLVLMVLFSGYICPFNGIPTPWIWVFYLNPFAWAIQSLVINQFTSSDYDFSFIPGSNEKFGYKVLISMGYETDYIYVWYGVLFILGQYLFFILATTFILTYLRTAPAMVPPIEDTEADGELVEAMDNFLSNKLENGSNKQPFFSLKEEDEMSPQTTVVPLSALPFEPVAFSFDNIWYTVQISKTEEIDLLKGVQGFFLPGTVTALMGSSGAGKTTLLDVLSGRKNSGIIKGTMTVNGKPKDDHTFRRMMAYVEQFDTLFPHDTVREAVEFSAAMRLNRDITIEERNKWIDQVMAMMELGPISNRMVGNTSDGGLSFEQKKRVSMAIELVSNPSILFLDEPTTGLDSRGAQVLIRVIRRLAAQGRSIVCTIHQPSSYIFTSFDSLLLLRRGGQTVYFGPIGNQGITSDHSIRNCYNLINYFENIPGVTPIGTNQNPASWMLEQLGAGTSTTSTQSVIDLHEFYKVSTLGEGNNRKVEELSSKNSSNIINLEEVTNESIRQCRLVDTYTQLLKPKTVNYEFSASESTQLIQLFKRTITGYWRSPQYNFSRMIVSIVVALIFGSVYPQQNYVNANDLLSRSAVQYITLLFCGIIAQLSCMPVMAAERPGFYREQQSQMYRVVYYELAYFIVEIPYMAVSSLLFTIPFFYIVGFDKNEIVTKFFWYWLVQFMYTAVCVYIGHLLAAACPSLDYAAIFMGMISTFNSLFCGFYIAPQNIPTFWKFVYWLSPLHYAFEAHVFVQSHGDKKLVTTLTGQKMTAEDFYPTVFQDWSYHNRGFDMMALVLIIGILRFFNYMAMKYLRHQTR